jgi:hypothetical protein
METDLSRESEEVREALEDTVAFQGRWQLGQSAVVYQVVSFEIVFF